MVVWNMSSQGDTFVGDGFFVILGLYNIYFLLKSGIIYSPGNLYCKINLFSPSLLKLH